MISKDDIKKLANLARIDITEQEEEKFQHDLEHILSYIENLSRAETGTIEATTRVHDTTNVMRNDADDVKLDSSPEELIAGAPHIEGRYIKVKSVFN